MQYSLIMVLLPQLLQEPPSSFPIQLHSLSVITNELSHYTEIFNTVLLCSELVLETSSYLPGIYVLRTVIVWKN